MVGVKGWGSWGKWGSINHWVGVKQCRSRVMGVKGAVLVGAKNLYIRAKP